MQVKQQRYPTAEELLRRWGDTLRLERHKRRLTQMQVAELAEVSQKRVFTVENGEGTLRAVTVIASALRIDLFGTAETEERPEAPVRARRRALGLTQEDLAEAVDCDQTMISAIELNGVSPSMKLAQALATTLESTLDDLFGTAVMS